MLFFEFLTVIEVYGNDGGMKAVACGQNKGFG